MNLEKINERLEKTLAEIDTTLDEIASGSNRNESATVKFLSKRSELSDSLVELKRLRQSTAKGKYNELIEREGLSDSGVLDGILTLKAFQPKIQHLEDSIAKIDGSIEAARDRKKKQDCQKEGHLKKKAHIVNLQRLLSFITAFYKWAEVYKESETLFLMPRVRLSK